MVNEVMVTELVDRTRLHALPELWAALELWVHCGEGTEAQEAVKTFLTALHVTGGPRVGLLGGWVAKAV